MLTNNLNLSEEFDGQNNQEVYEYGTAWLTSDHH